jgi:hypothetical protein
VAVVVLSAKRNSERDGEKREQPGFFHKELLLQSMTLGCGPDASHGCVFRLYFQ